MAHQVFKDWEKAQPAELKTAVPWQGTSLAGKHWPRVLWICLQHSAPFCDGVAERTKADSLKNQLHKPEIDSAFSLIECLQTFNYSYFLSLHPLYWVTVCYRYSQSTLSLVQWKTTEKTNRTQGLKTSNR